MCRDKHLSKQDKASLLVGLGTFCALVFLNEPESPSGLFSVVAFGCYLCVISCEPLACHNESGGAASASMRARLANSRSPTWTPPLASTSVVTLWHAVASARAWCHGGLGSVCTAPFTSQRSYRHSPRFCRRSLLPVIANSAARVHEPFFNYNWYLNCTSQIGERTSSIAEY